MWGSLRVRLLSAMVVLPILVAAAITMLAIERFRDDKELYVYDLSAQVVELVARNVSTQLSSLRLRADLAKREMETQSEDAKPTQPFLSITTCAKPTTITARNVSDDAGARLEITAPASERGLIFDVKPRNLLDLRGYAGPTTLMILNDKGEVLAHPEAKEVAQRRDLNAILRQLSLFDRGAARIGTKEIVLDGTAQLVAYARVTPSIAVLQTMNKDRVFAAAAPLVTNAIITASIVAVVAVLLALLLSGTVIRPLRSMMRQVEAIGRGEFGVAVQTSPASGAIGNLARQLNEMSSALKARDEEVSLMQRQVLRAERVNTAGRMISAIAKELNAPLDTCFSLATECQRLEPGNMKIRDNHVQIAQEANRAANILQNLSRVGAGEEQEAVGIAGISRSVELDMLISDVIVSSGALLRQRKLEVETELQTTKAVEVQPDELRNLLLDLLLFVADHAQPDGPVRVSLQQQASEAVIDVSFSGTSWSEEQRRQLANPYDSACYGEGSLMLAVSALVLEDQGGRLEVDEVEGRNRIRLFMPLGTEQRRRATMELLEAGDA